MFEYFAEAWANLRIISKYTPGQKKSLTKLQDAFLSCVKKDLTGTLLESDINGIPTQNSDTLAGKLLSTIQSERIQADSPLSVYANSILLDISQYLYRRNQNFLNGYSNDPINLFCLQFADWLKNRLMRAECKKETLDEVTVWINYLQNVNDGLTFSYYEQMDVMLTLNVTLSNIESVLIEVKGLIKLELSRNTIEKELQSLVNHGKNYINFCFEYLFYALNDLKDPPRNFSIINLNISNLTLMPEINQIIQKTVLGKCLSYLALNENVSELFVPAQHRNKIEVESQKSLISSFPCQSDSKSAFLLSDGQVNRSIFQRTISESKTTSQTKQEFSSGIIKFELTTSSNKWDKSFNQSAVMEIFIQVCGFLDVFTKIVLNCREAAYLSGKTGDLLLCKISHAQLDFLLKSFKQLYKAIYNEIDKLQQIIKQFNIELLAQKTVDHACQQNLPISRKIFSHVESYQNNNVFGSHLTSIRDSMGTIDKQIIETRRRLFSFIQDVNNISQNMPWLAPKSKLRTLQPVMSTQAPIFLSNKDNILSHTPLPVLPPRKDNIEAIKPVEKPKKAVSLQSSIGISTVMKQTLKGKLNNRDICLREIVIPPSFESGFQGLEVQRDEIIKQLLNACADNELLWRLIAPEAAEFFTDKPLPKLFNFVENFQKYNNTFEYLRKFMNQLHAENHFLNGKSDVEVLAWIEENPAYNKRYQGTIAEYRELLRQSNNLMHQYCTKKSFILTFLKYCYLDKRAGLLCPKKTTGTFDAVAEFKRHNLYIWELQENSQIAIVKSYVCSIDTLSAPKHLLCVKRDEKFGYICFNQLVDTEQSLTKSMLLSAYSFFELDKETMLNQAITLQENNQHGESLRYLNELILKEPKNAKLLFMRAKGILSDATHAKRQLAINDFTLSLKYCDGDKKLEEAILIERAITFECLNDPTKAIADYNKILELNPDNVDILINRGYAFMLSGEKELFNKGKEDFAKAEILSPNNIELLWKRSEICISHGDYDQVILDTGKLCQIDSTDKVAGARLQEALRLKNQQTAMPKK